MTFKTWVSGMQDAWSCRAPVPLQHIAWENSLEKATVQIHLNEYTSSLYHHERYTKIQNMKN